MYRFVAEVDLVNQTRYSRRTKSEMNVNLSDLEALLQSKKLGNSLVSPQTLTGEHVVSTGVSDLDTALGGGFVRGHLSEIVGPRSSGITSVLTAMLAAATSRGETVALIDAFDGFDPAFSHAAGIHLPRLLWIRGRQISSRIVPCRIDQVLKAAMLVMQAGCFGVVAVDLTEAPVSAIRRLPFTTWLRLSRAIEAKETVGIVTGPVKMGRSASGRSIVLETRYSAKWSGRTLRSRIFQGIDIDVRVESTRHPFTSVHLSARHQYLGIV